MKRLKEEGKALAVGVSNLNLEQLEQFAGGMPDCRIPAAIQYAAAWDRVGYASLVPPARSIGIGVLAADERAFCR